MCYELKKSGDAKLKKIISIFLMLLLVSGCEKVDALRNAPPVGRQDSQSVQSQKNQTVKLAETVKQAGYIVGVFALALVLYAGYKAYRYYCPISPLEKEYPGWNTFAERIPDISDETITPYLNKSELTYWEAINQEKSLSEPKQRCFVFLNYFCGYSINSDRRGMLNSEFDKLPPAERFEIALKLFNLEMESRRSASHGAS